MTESDLTRMDERCWNWGRWASGGFGGQGTCASAERMYVPDKVDEIAFERSARMPVDIPDAELIERAVLLITAPSQRKFLVLKYVWRMNRMILARRFHLGESMLQGFAIDVLRAVGGRLHSPSFHDCRFVKPLWARA